MVELINPNAIVSEPALIDVAPPTVIAPLDDAVAANRANKYAIGLPQSSATYDQSLDMIRTSREQDLRNQAASEIDMQNSIQQQKYLNEFAKKNGPITMPTALMLRSIMSKKQADPNAVIEENYAENFFKELVTHAQANPGSVYAEALRDLPVITNQAANVASNLKTRKELIQTALEDAQAAAKSQSWPGFFVDMSKGLTAVYGEAKLRGMAPAAGYLNGLLGTNVEKQWYELLSGPMDNLKNHLNGPVKQLIKDNPQLAVQWLSAAKGMSADEKLILNLLPALDLSMVGGAAKGAKSIIRAVELNRQANKVLAQLVTGEEKVATKGAIKEAVGDIKGAGLEDFTTEVVQTLKGDAPKVTSVLDDMHVQFKGVVIDPLTDMGAPSGLTMRQEVVNRLRESSKTLFQSFVDTIEKSMKVEQLPAVLATKETAALLAKALKENYKGLVNSVFNSELIRDKATGQWFVRHYLMNNDGVLFDNLRQAQAFVEKNQMGEVVYHAPEGPGKPVTKTVPKEKELLDLDRGVLDDTDLVRKPSRNPPFKYDKDEILLENDYEGAFKEPRQTVQIEQKGAGFFITKTMPVPIDADFVRALMITTGETKTPNKVINAWGGWLGSARTPEETLALTNIINRKIAAYGPANFYDAMKANNSYIKDLKSWTFGYTTKDAAGKEIYKGNSKYVKWGEWKNVMSWLENEPNPANGKKGIIESFSTPGELQQKYVERVNRLPDPQETAAAFAFRNQEMIKQQLLKFTKFKDELRQGSSRWTLAGLDTDTSVKTRAGVGNPIRERQFNGTDTKKLPTANDVVLILADSADLGFTPVSKHTLMSGKQLVASKFGEELAGRIERGELKSVKLSNPDEMPLNDMYASELTGETRVTHVISSKLQDKPLTIDHIKTNKINNHDYDHYIIQPRIIQNSVSGAYEYLGDRTLAGFNIRGMAGQVAKELDDIRIALRANDELGAKAAHDLSRLPMSFEEIKGWFRPDRTMEGTVTQARLNLDERIHVVPNGKMSNDVDTKLFDKYRSLPGGFEDRTAETYNQVKLHDPWDIFTLENTGTKANPIWNQSPVKYIDPMTSINRGLVRAINSDFLNDYKVYAIEHWIQEAKDLMRVSKESLASAPNYFFHNPQWLTGLTGEDAIKQQNLMTSQMQIKQFLGVRDANTTFLHNAAQILSDSIYGASSGLLPEIAKPYMLAFADELPRLRDPFRFMRSVAFNVKVGLFAPAQLIVQLQTFSNIAGVAGLKNATSGTGATLLHSWARINQNPEILTKLDQHATRLGFKPGEFLEARAHLERSGFENVSTEHIYRDSSAYHDLIGGSTEKFLNAGQYLFREGERASRTGAWYTAYQEFRTANPVRKITEADVQQILNRADLLSGNMSRASASLIQKGIWSTMTQFTTYTIRQAELMLGSRLSPTERMRLFSTYATFYGIPAAFGSFTLGIGNELIMKDAVDKGYMVDDPTNSWYNTLLTEGLPHLMAKLATGNDYNIGARYASGSGPITDLMRSDKPWWEIIGGASGSIIVNGVKSLDGFTTAMLSAIRGDGKFTMKPEDFLDPFKQTLSSVAAADKFRVALNTGKWMTAKEMEVGDASPLNALFMTATGLNPASVSEIGYIFGNKEDEKKNAARTEKEFLLEMHRGFREFDKGNPEQGHEYWTRAFTRLKQGDYPLDQYSKVIGMASEGNENVIQRMRLDYYLGKNVPESKVPMRDDAAKRYLSK